MSMAPPSPVLALVEMMLGSRWSVLVKRMSMSLALMLPVEAVVIWLSMRVMSGALTARRVRRA